MKHSMIQMCKYETSITTRVSLNVVANHNISSQSKCRIFSLVEIVYSDDPCTYIPPCLLAVSNSLFFYSFVRPYCFGYKHDNVPEILLGYDWNGMRKKFCSLFVLHCYGNGVSCNFSNNVGEVEGEFSSRPRRLMWYPFFIPLWFIFTPRGFCRSLVVTSTPSHTICPPLSELHTDVHEDDDLDCVGNSPPCA